MDQEEAEDFTELDPLKSKINSNNNETFCDKCKFMFKNVTVEPSTFMFVAAAMIGLITTQNLSLEKACRVNLNYTDEICDSLKMQSLDTQNEYEKNAQKLLARALASKTYITATVPCIMAAFIGSWSDKTGRRKIFHVLGLTGQILLCINNMLNVYFFKQLSLEVLIFSEAFFEGFSGGWCIFLMTSFSFISAITTDDTRTYRLGLINFCLSAGFPIGMGTSGVILKKYGYYAGYGITAGIHTLNLAYVLFVVSDPVRSKDQKEHDGKGFRHFLKSFLDPSHVLSTIKVLLLKSTTNNRRRRLIIFLCVLCILFGPMYGEISVTYLSTRFRFNWDELDFSIFQTYNFIVHTCGTIFSIIVFSKLLQWHDSALGIISSVSKITSSILYCFATTAVLFYLAPAVDVLGGTGIIALRSLFTKTVEPDELGKINSLIALTENVMPLIYVPLYTYVYTATMDVLPGAFFLMGTFMTIPALIVFLWLIIEHRRGLKKLRSEEAAMAMK